MKTAEQYIIEKYGSRAFARALGLNDAQSIIDLMDDFADYKSEQVAQKALNDAAENAEMVYHSGHFKTNMASKHCQIGADNVRINKDSIRNTKIELI